MKKLKGGCCEVRLVLAPDVIAFAETQWQALGHPSIDDYLNTVLNTALFHEEVRAEEEADKVSPPLLTGFDEMDDDIPFDPVPLPTHPRVTKS